MARRMKAADIESPSSFLPPKRPSSLPNLTESRSSRQNTTADAQSNTIISPPPFLPPRRSPQSRAEQSIAGSVKPRLRPLTQKNESRPTSLQSFSSGDTVAFTGSNLHREPSNNSERSKRLLKTGLELPVRSPKLEPIHDDGPLRSGLNRPPPPGWPPGPPTALRQSSLRVMSRLSEDDLGPPMLPPAVLGTSRSDPQLGSERRRPSTHPLSALDRKRMEQIDQVDQNAPTLGEEDPWRLPALPPSRPSTPQSALRPKPTPSFARLSSFDNLLTYREEKAEWKRISRSPSMIQRAPSEPAMNASTRERAKTFAMLEDPIFYDDQMVTDLEDGERDANHPSAGPVVPAPSGTRNRFRHIAAEIGFCFTIAMTQFLAEYLISGFALELPRILSSHIQIGPGAMGMFWPASLLSLILSATLFIFARLADMYSGYLIFMFGVAWLAIWTLIPGFSRTLIWLDIARAMQGLAIAAFMPSTFTMVGSIYPEGPRKNFVMGLYSGCAPLGFFAGFLCAGTLPVDKPQWYFWIASVLSAVTLITAFLSVPSDRTDRQKLKLKMDWIGAFLIMAGLILVSYALGVEPYANQFEATKSAWAFPIVIGPFASGIVCLALAFWYEGWQATCPLLPFHFFKPKSVKSFSLACLCFYASFGVWLYNSAQYFQSPTGTTSYGMQGMSGTTLALWYTPTAIGGVILCIVGGSLMHIVPIMILLIISALAWIAAPLLLALAPLPLNYWSYVVPSMLCATIGIDLTFTISIVFFSSVQPLRYQGLSGAVCSSLVNLAMSFALSISEIVSKEAQSSEILPIQSINWGFQASFLYGAASAGLGLIICVICVRISRSVVREQPTDEERPRPPSSDSTLVSEGEERDQEELQQGTRRA
ncbi:hypothetical protein LTR37_003337 [Vermiconidia calcicola]|uniref:Uncharacterized protein n=1 Tax=Vermiconidia calcicola TaxID=1690605 RepID=A0ACC3NRS4_9PEZI|nr:hypothetical protein LTR37_003337 [Vermiconidia calcicola]